MASDHTSMKPANIALILLAALAGWQASRWWPAAVDSSVKMERRILCYQSPMHPWVKADKPGQCTICGMPLVPIYEGGADFDHSAEDIVMMPKGTPNVLGVQTVEVKKQPLVRTLRVSGMIGEDESRHGIISATVEGRLDGLAMSGEGDKMTRRQPIATIFSRPLLAAAEDYKLALAQGSPDLEKVKRRLMQYGLVWEQIAAIPTRQADDLYFGMLAPLTGTIVKSYVSEGQYVKEGDRLFEIADFTTMWLVFAAYEQDLPLIQVGQIVTVSTPSLPGQPTKARVSFINPNLDETTRSAKVRVVLENPDRRFKNKTFAEGQIELEAPEVMAVPRTSVLWSGTKPHVYVERTPNAYERRDITLGRSGDALWEIKEGLKEGERIVMTGNMLMEGQAQMDAPVMESSGWR